jgi:hypothetical protein
MIRITLRKNRTGETRVIEWEGSDTWKDAEFNWLENNWACDCNRHREWLRAKGPPKVGNRFWNNAHNWCGNWRYEVLSVEETDGTVIDVFEDIDYRYTF